MPTSKHESRPTGGLREDGQSKAS